MHTFLESDLVGTGLWPTFVELTYGSGGAHRRAEPLTGTANIYLLFQCANPTWYTACCVVALADVSDARRNINVFPAKRYYYSEFLASCYFRGNLIPRRTPLLYEGCIPMYGVDRHYYAQQASYLLYTCTWEVIRLHNTVRLALRLSWAQAHAHAPPSSLLHIATAIY